VAEQAHEKHVMPFAIAEEHIAKNALVAEAHAVVQADGAVVVRVDIQPDAVPVQLQENVVERQRERLLAKAAAALAAVGDGNVQVTRTVRGPNAVKADQADHLTGLEMLDRPVDGVVLVGKPLVELL